MLELVECNQILVTNPFADDSSAAWASNDHDTLVNLTRSNPSSEHHPLRSLSVSPARRYSTQRVQSPPVVGSGDGTRPGLTGLLSSDESPARVVAEEDQTTADEAPRGGRDIITHTVGPNDSVAGVALRYGVSIAALRRANQLWPSDPIHLRTELLIPRGDTLRARRKPTHGVNTSTSLQFPVEPTPSPSTDLVASSFIAARNMIVSVLPARLSLESLSSRTSASEDHELDDLQRARARRISAVQTRFAQEGHELSVLVAPHAQYVRPGTLPSSLNPRSSTNERLEDRRIPSASDLHMRPNFSSSTVSVGRPSRAQPFAALPVRTSQLEPEPAMELPIRRPRISRSSFLDGRFTTPNLNAFK